MLNLQRLTVLHELELRGSLAAVARALNYSPSAISQQIAQLEREIGIALTEPVGRGVRLTDAAEMLVRHTRIAIAALESAESELAAASPNVSGRLRVACFQSALLSLLPAALETLDRDHPDLDLDIAQRDVDEAMSGLQAGSFDVVVGEEYPGASLLPRVGIERAEVGADEMVLALPEGEEWTGLDQLFDLAEAPWALDPASSAPGRWARDLCMKAGFEPDVRFDGVDLLVHLQMVRAGYAIAIVPLILSPDWVSGVRIEALPGAPKRQLFTLTREARSAHPAVIAFRRALRLSFRGHQLNAT
ncbi:LysR family transcriptional regulator [Mycolicibacterium sp. 018/SC-01/001]|uniref:LysR family transcriptional regulator n=1 Tax=Mycolicibacterium sp. 018/SC-01/001 TaxID=2592069 RepID=UPI00117ED96A|nr:LysR family transcriptional regulator [Mycolicibacterium sp. 018/SC-01/001]TRW80968.1 LysR family transcriptional regulator [Mycolicibacterium sp. 018/SC-01/001]